MATTPRLLLLMLAEDSLAPSLAHLVPWQSVRLLLTMSATLCSEWTASHDSTGPCSSCLKATWF